MLPSASEPTHSCWFYGGAWKDHEPKVQSLTRTSVVWRQRLPESGGVGPECYQLEMSCKSWSNLTNTTGPWEQHGRECLVSGVCRDAQRGQ